MVLSAMPMDLSTFWVVGSVCLKEEISLVIDAVPFSLYCIAVQEEYLVFGFLCRDLCKINYFRWCKL